jgi:cytochrome b561
MLKNTLQSYGLIARLLHWTMAILILGMIGMGYVLIQMPPSDLRSSLFGIHKATGLLILVLVSCRLLWRYHNVTPLTPNTIPPWQRSLAKLNIFTLYSLMFLVPVSGLGGALFGGYPLSFYGLFTIPSLTKNPKIASYF